MYDTHTDRHTHRWCCGGAYLQWFSLEESGRLQFLCAWRHHGISRTHEVLPAMRERGREGGREGERERERERESVCITNEKHSLHIQCESAIVDPNVII